MKSNFVHAYIYQVKKWKLDQSGWLNYLIELFEYFSQFQFLANLFSKSSVSVKISERLQTLSLQLY